MKKRLLILLLLAVGTWVAIHYWPAVKMAVIDPNWPEINYDNVQSMEFRNLNGVHRAVRKDGRFVIMHNGFEYRAVEIRLSEIIDFLHNFKPKRRMEDIPKDKLGGFGLDNATIRFTVQTDEDVWRLDVGEQNPQKSGYYAINSRSGDILIIPSGFNEKLGRKYEIFVQKTILDVDPYRVTEISVQGPGVDEFVLSKKYGKFVFLAPEELQQIEVDQNEAAEYVKVVSNMICSKFLEDPIEEMPPLDSRFQVTVLGEEKPLNVSVYKGEGKDNFIGESPDQPVPFTILETNLDRMYIDPMELKSKAVISLDTGKIDKMKLLEDTPEGKKSLSLVRSGTDWLIEGSNKPVAGINTMLWRLLELKYTAEPSEKLPETAKLAFTWELTGSKGGPAETVLLYTDSAFPEGQMWLQVKGTEQYFPVKDQLLKELQTML